MGRVASAPGCGRVAPTGAQCVAGGDEADVEEGDGEEPEGEGELHLVASVIEAGWMSGRSRADVDQGNVKEGNHAIGSGDHGAAMLGVNRCPQDQVDNIKQPEKEAERESRAPCPPGAQRPSPRSCR